MLTLKEVHVDDCIRSGLPQYTLHRYDCGGTYVCNRCERVCGFCFGAADDTPGICDDCLFEIGHVEEDEQRDRGRQEVPSL